MKKQTNRPLVSVIMPAYNAEDYIAQAIDSILTQTYSKFELIVVDDASTDDTWQVISQYQQKFPKKIRAIKLRKNRNKGGDEAGNLAFAMAKGELIARMDADDVAHPKRFAKQVAFLAKNSKVSLVGSSAVIINKLGEEIGEKVMPANHQDIFNEYFTFHPMIHPTLMIRRSVLKNEKKLYRIEHPSNNDYLTFFSMINEGHIFANLPDKLLSYRMHGKNDSLSNVKKTFANTIKTRQMMIKRYGYKPTATARLKSLTQAVMVGMIPESVVFILYLLIRKIYTPAQLLANFKQLSSDLIENFVNTAHDRVVSLALKK